MKEQIVQATIESLLAIHNERFFQTELGFKGEFAACLRNKLIEYNVLRDTIILETEHQKKHIHQTCQRPDIILHIPIEESGATPNENNFAVWALKHRATAKKAEEDFVKLDIMFSTLNYPIGIFINISNERTFLDNYKGRYPERILGFAINRINGEIKLFKSTITPNAIITERI